SELGRFVSEDPAGDPNNPNLYSYCRNNPLKFLDPTGLYGYDASTGTISHADGTITDTSGKTISTPPGGSSSGYYYRGGGGSISTSVTQDEAQKASEANKKNKREPWKEYDPLVFVHGYKDNWTLWADFLSEITDNDAFRALADAYDKSKDPIAKKSIVNIVQATAKLYGIYVFDYSDSNTQNPNKIAKEFVKYLKENNIYDKTPDIIAHSMGNLVTRAAIEYNGLVVNNFAMIAPPNSGSKLARFGEGEAGDYMEPNSKELEDLNKDKNLAKLEANVKGKIQIFTALGDIAIGNNYNIPGMNIPTKIYEAGKKPGQVPYSKNPARGGTHINICHTITVMNDVMNFINNN
ncbi:MAG: alpha/beta hydrolase, partial [Firmicutes bacterium]|nr:alpha/beta hydrolase [Bacillota bacterium]